MNAETVSIDSRASAVVWNAEPDPQHQRDAGWLYCLEICLPGRRPARTEVRGPFSTRGIALALAQMEWLVYQSKGQPDLTDEHP